MHAIQLKEFGGPEVLHYAEVAKPEPGNGEVRIAVEAAGVNFIDVYHRTGAYQNALPLVIGQEAAGVVDAIGEGVTDVTVGDRVGYAGVMGAYAEYAIVPAAKLVPVPDGVESTAAAASFLQGMTRSFGIPSRISWLKRSVRPKDVASMWCTIPSAKRRSMAAWMYCDHVDILCSSANRVERCLQLIRKSSTAKGHSF
jgi:hypothetical protein